MQYHDEYAAINARVHRKPALILGSPALVRHVAFWKPAGDARNNWVRAADCYLGHVYRAIKALDIDAVCLNQIAPLGELNQKRFYLFDHLYLDDPSLSADARLRPIFRSEQDKGYDGRIDITVQKVPSRFKTVIFKFKFHHVPTLVKCELHHEYFSITIAHDYSITPGTAPRDTMLASSPSKDIRAVIDMIRKEVGERYTAQKSDQEHIGERRRKLQPAHDYIYNLYWERLDAAILSVPAESGLNTKIGRVFYDSRGLILLMNEKPATQPDEAMAPPVLTTDLFPQNHISFALESIRPQPFFVDTKGFDIKVLRCVLATDYGFR